MSIMDFLTGLNDLLWHDLVIYVVLGVGVLFTLWSGFSQYRALTHGVQVVRGKYDRRDDPGAINHFQALSAALSATVGLGNIAGVALAVGVGGPGAVFWMWVVGFVGMALKLTEVTMAMLSRNLDDPANPSGGAMWVVDAAVKGKGPALRLIGRGVAILFCLTLVVSGVTGGNMFQAWNVADVTFSYFGVDKAITGVILTVLVGLVIIGGIKRIGSVAGKLVPMMCILYLGGALWVLIADAGRIPEMLRLIVRSAFAPSEAAGAFVGGTAGFAFLKGMQRALFSNEAGQGSSPIAHCAAKTDEPVREGIVAGLEPFIDTLVVCTLTAIVIMLTGMWNREPALTIENPPAFEQTDDGWSLGTTTFSVRNEREAKDAIQADQTVFAIVDAGTNPDSAGTRHRLDGHLRKQGDGSFAIAWDPFPGDVAPKLVTPGAWFGFTGATLTAKAFDSILPGLGLWIVPLAVWLFALSTMISWSYYCEQGMVYMFGRRSVMPYRWFYCACVLLACTPLIRTENELDIISSLGTGVMLWVNIPIMVVFGHQTMKAYFSYLRRWKRGEFEHHRDAR